MTGRRRRITASSGKSVIGSGLTGKRRPRTATTLSVIIPPPHNISDSGQLKTNVEAQLQALKDYMDNKQASFIKQIDDLSSKLKKRWKQETHGLRAIGEAADTDWRNFLADHEEDTQEHQNSVEVLFTKLEASVTHFTKTSIPELLKSVEMSVDTIKNRHARSAKSARRLSAREFKSNTSTKFTDIPRKIGLQ